MIHVSDEGRDSRERENGDFPDGRMIDHDDCLHPCSSVLVVIDDTKVKKEQNVRLRTSMATYSQTTENRKYEASTRFPQALLSTLLSTVRGTPSPHRILPFPGSPGTQGFETPPTCCQRVFFSRLLSAPDRQMTEFSQPASIARAGIRNLVVILQHLVFGNHGRSKSPKFWFGLTNLISTRNQPSHRRSISQTPPTMPHQIIR